MKKSYINNSLSSQHLQVSGTSDGQSYRYIIDEKYLALFITVHGAESGTLPTYVLVQKRK